MAATKKRLLCLHSSAGSSDIIRAQLKPLNLEASFDLDFLNGSLVADAAKDSDAAMLKKFFPSAPNRNYMSKVQYDPASGACRPAPGNATNPALLKEMGIEPPTPYPADGKDWQTEYRGVESALTLLTAQLVGEANAGRRYDGGVAAFSQGANLITLLLGVLESAEHAAAAEETAAAALPAGPEKAAAKKAAKAATDKALRRSRLARPAAALLFCPTDFGWMAPFADAAAVAQCISAVDAGILQADTASSDGSTTTPDVTDAAAAAPPPAVPPTPPPPADDGSSVPPPATPSAAVPLFCAGAPPLAKTKTLIVLGAKDALNAGGRKVAGCFAPAAVTLLEHSEGHKPPTKADPSIVQRVVNFATRGMADEIISGCSAFYRHRTLGWIAVKVTKVDYQGECDGGATYCVTAPQLDGEVETVRSRLALTKPEAQGEVASAL